MYSMGSGLTQSSRGKVKASIFDQIDITSHYGRVMPIGRMELRFMW